MNINSVTMKLFDTLILVNIEDKKMKKIFKIFKKHNISIMEGTTILLEIKAALNNDENEKNI